LKAPDWLSEGVKAKWDELALRLHNCGLLTDLDLDVFAAYCTAWSNCRDADEALRNKGATTEAQCGYTSVSRAVTRAKNHLAEIIELGGLLGLSPLIRTRIEVSPEGNHEDALLV
jgi:P27 family predicted phage terminase small subunit